MSVKFPSGGMKERTRSDSQRLNRTHGWKLTSSRRRGFCPQKATTTTTRAGEFYTCTNAQADPKKHSALRKWTHHKGQSQVRHPSEPYAGFNHTLDLCKYCCALKKKVDGDVSMFKEQLDPILSNISSANTSFIYGDQTSGCFLPDLSRMASISSITSKYASLLVYLTPARLHGILDNWPVGNVSPTLLPPVKHTKKVKKVNVQTGIISDLAVSCQDDPCLPVSVLTTDRRMVGGLIISLRTLDSVASGKPLSSISSNSSYTVTTLSLMTTSEHSPK